MFLEINTKLDEFFSGINVMSYSMLDLQKMTEGICLEIMRPHARELLEKAHNKSLSLLRTHWETEIAPRIAQEYEEAVQAGQGDAFIRALQHAGL